VISIRACTADDAPQLAALEGRSAPHPWSVRQYSDSLAGSHQGFAIEQDHILVGHCIVMCVLDEAEILNIVIDQPHQGNGLGAWLLQQVLHALSQSGIHRVFLEVRESNSHARALYLRSGFQPNGLRKNYYPGENGREHAILMEALL
jgi:ribosomal-protein-alanine N-acetyltransferase